MNREIYERLKKISQRLKEKYHAQKVILFGSYARGDAKDNSDVDILVIAPTKEDFFERIATVKTIIHEFRYHLPFFPIVLTQEELDERIKIGDQFIQEIIKTMFPQEELE